MSLIRSSFTVGFYTLGSRLLGFLRDVVIASFLGTGMLADAFFVAFKIPNFLRRLFAEGAFNAAFVPLYAGALTEEGKENANQFASEALSLLVTILLVLCIVCIALMPWLLMVLAPGFADDATKYDVTVTLTRITFPYILFISVVSLLGGVLNSHGKFAAVAATPILLNLCLICIPLAIHTHLPTYAHALAVAVFCAGVIQSVWLLFWCKKLGVMPRLTYPRMTAQIKKLFKLIAPAAMGAGVAQINLLIDLIIASHIAGAVSYLYYADRINQLPLGIIGVGIGTALLPMLSKQIKAGNTLEAMHTQNRAMELALLFALPATAALMILAEPIVHVLYERGEFTAADTAAVAPALIAFAAGLPAFILVKVLAPAFYAHRDTKTPFIIASICIVVNIALCLILIQFFSHVGMAMATTFSSWLNVTLMMRNLKKRDMLHLDKQVLARMPKMLLAALAMMFGLWLLAPHLADWMQGGFALKLTALLGVCAVGMIGYFGLAFSVGAIEKRDLKRLKQ